MGNRVLIADDATFMRMLLRDILTSNGYEVIGEAVDGAEAISLYKKQKPDLVMLDISMPLVDGVRSVREIRAIDREAKIVMISSMGQQEMVAESIRYGALDFVLKPFKSDRVIGTLEKALLGADE